MTMFHSFFPSLPPIHGEIKIGVLYLCLFSEFDILVWFLTLTLNLLGTFANRMYPKKIVLLLVGMIISLVLDNVSYLWVGE